MNPPPWFQFSLAFAGQSPAAKGLNDLPDGMKTNKPQPFLRHSAKNVKMLLSQNRKKNRG
jgi:hypothetical protein